MIPPPHVPTEQYFFSVFAFLGFVIVCIPFPWHFQSRNTGTCMYMAWVAIGCLNQFVNSVVWAKNAINYAPVWCDICALKSLFSGIIRG
jgi:pheromone a factor receptor